MRKWVLIGRDIVYLPKNVQAVRFWWKWDLMDIGHISPKMLISDIVTQKRAN